MTRRILLAASVALALAAAGCSAASARGGITLTAPGDVRPPPGPSASQPATIDADTIAGQIAVKLAPKIEASMETRLELAVKAAMQAVITANVQGIGYTSYFGVGPTLIVSSALVLVLLASTLDDVMRHKRKMARINKRKE